MITKMGGGSWCRICEVCLSGVMQDTPQAVVFLTVTGTGEGVYRSKWMPNYKKEKGYTS